MGETGGIDAIILLHIQAIFILFPCIKPELINISHSPKAGMLSGKDQPAANLAQGVQLLEQALHGIASAS